MYNINVFTSLAVLVINATQRKVVNIDRVHLEKS